MRKTIHKIDSGISTSSLGLNTNNLTQVFENTSDPYSFKVAIENKSHTPKKDISDFKLDQIKQRLTPIKDR